MKINTIKLLYTQDTPPTNMTFEDAILFMGVGVFCGLIGASFVALAHALVTTRNAMLRKSLPPEVTDSRRYTMVFVGAAVVAALLYVENAYVVANTTSGSTTSNLTVKKFGSFMFEKV